MTTTALQSADFLQACLGRPVSRTPIWIMRQAGRYLRSYREVRARHDFMTVCRTPELACEVTLQPVQQFGVDAAILFSDILVVMPCLGLKVRFSEAQGAGPIIDDPIQDVGKLPAFSPDRVDDELRYVFDAVTVIRRALPAHVPLIGFSGAPFTLACYALEGKTSRDFNVARSFFHREPDAAKILISRISDVVEAYVSRQIDAGANCIQLFDTWGGLLSAAQYKEWALPCMKRIIERIRKRNVPVIVFVKGTTHLLDLLIECGANVIGCDWRVDMRALRQKIGNQPAVQGNLTPLALLGSRESLRTAAQDVCDSVRVDGQDTGHIFNLGHGITPDAPEDNVKFLVDFVHEFTEIKQGSGA